MRKYLLAAVAAAAITSPAAARNGAAYIGLEGGAIFSADTDIDVAVDDGVTDVDYDDAFSLDYKPGLDVDAIIGYDLGGFRLEGEVAYKRLKIDDFEISEDLVGDLEDNDIDIDEFDLDDKVSVLSGMVNALADFGDDDGWSFYAGGGVGRARVKMFDEKDSAWAWQLIAGVRTAVSDNVDLGLKYRYFQTGKLDFLEDFALDDDVFANANGKFSSHSVLASLVFNFGGAEPVEEAAPMPPPPPPPPPPATQICPDGSTIPATSYCPPPPPPPPAPSGERG